MKKTVAAFIILSLAIVVLALTSFNITSARASSSYSIESVNHTVGVLSNGYVLVNDTIAISGQTDSFLLGFPHTFGPNVVSAIAYNTTNTFPVSLNVPFEDTCWFLRDESRFLERNTAGLQRHICTFRQFSAGLFECKFVSTCFSSISKPDRNRPCC